MGARLARALKEDLRCLPDLAERLPVEKIHLVENKTILLRL